MMADKAIDQGRPFLKEKIRNAELMKETIHDQENGKVKHAI